jgi:hypothetical protein
MKKVLEKLFQEEMAFHASSLERLTIANVELTKIE